MRCGREAAQYSTPHDLLAGEAARRSDEFMRCWRVELLPVHHAPCEPFERRTRLIGPVVVNRRRPMVRYRPGGVHQVADQPPLDRVRLAPRDSLSRIGSDGEEHAPCWRRQFRPLLDERACGLPTRPGAREMRASHDASDFRAKRRRPAAAGRAAGSAPCIARPRGRRWPPRRSPNSRAARASTPCRRDRARSRRRVRTRRS